MSEGPYRNMTYEDAANAMQKIYEVLYPRKFHSYNTGLSEPFASFVGTRSENSIDPDTYETLYGQIGEIVNKYAPILGDESYSESDIATPTPANKSKVILDLHGMAILNSLLQVAELGARYIRLINTQINSIKNGTSGITPQAKGNAIANKYISMVTSVDSSFETLYGADTLKRVKNMIDKLSSVNRSNVVAKNVNVVTSISDYQVGQEDVISDAFDKDFIEYFIMYLDAENKLHDKTQTEYTTTNNAIRMNAKTLYSAYKGKQNKNIISTLSTYKFMRYVDVSGCRESCVGLCIGSCANTCFGCTDKCSGQCTVTCGDCSKGCMTNCSNTCQGACTDNCSGCVGNCLGGCKNECRDTCATTCTGICYEACVGSCFGTAEGFATQCGDCGSTCKGTCGNSCETESNGIPKAPDPKPPIIEITEDITPDPPVNPDNPDTPKPVNPGPGGPPSDTPENNADKQGLVAPNEQSMADIASRYGSGAASKTMDGYTPYVESGTHVENYKK